MRQNYPSPYPVYEPPQHKSGYEHGQDFATSMYGYPPPQRPPRQSFPRPVSYSPYSPEVRSQPVQNQRPCFPQHSRPGPRQQASPTPRRMGPYHECELDCPGSKHAMKSRNYPRADFRANSPVRDDIPDMSVREGHQDFECNPICLDKGQSVSQRAHPSQYQRTVQQQPTPLPQRRPVPVIECQADCPGSRHAINLRNAAKTTYRTYSPVRTEIAETNIDKEAVTIECLPQCPGYRKKQPIGECIPECRRFKQMMLSEDTQEKPTKKDCYSSCNKYQVKDTPTRAKTAQPPPQKTSSNQKECAGKCYPAGQQPQKSKKTSKTKPQQQGSTNECNPECVYSNSARGIAMMPNGAIAVDPRSMQELEAESLRSRNAR